MILQNSGRQFIFNDHDIASGPVIWWIQRDQRLVDNWTYIAAATEAINLNQPLVAVFCLREKYLDALPRAFDFMLQGLDELFNTLTEKSIPLILLQSENKSQKVPEDLLLKLVSDLRAGAVYTDFNPLRQVMSWKQQLGRKLSCPLIEVDTHNIIPCRIASMKQEYAARTFRPKVERQLEQWLHDFPELPENTSLQSNFFALLNQNLPQNVRIGEVEDETIGALSILYSKTQKYFQSIPLRSKSSLLPQSGCTAANKSMKEFIVRRELSDNFCFYNEHYDSFKGLPVWAQKTLKEHANDMRPYQYSQKQLENGETHDKLWNTAQLRMVRTGSMPGYLRMYWAKKILEWTVSPEDALSITIKLNDRYMLDGRDPNGYTGAAWSIGGVHDRPWVDRPIFGKIRLMTLSGCYRKFDVDVWVSANS